MKAKAKISGMLHSSFKPDKCKTSLKMAVARIKLLKNKREALMKQMRRDLAQLLDAGQDQTARIRVEHLIREEKTMAAYDLIDVYCELIVARMAIIDSQKNCPIDLKEAISSVVFASPRCADIPELMDVRKHFVAKYGKEFTTAALEVRPDSGVSRLIVEKLSAKAPDIDRKVKVLTEIAKEHNINWNPKAFEEQIPKSNSDLLDGPNTFTGASKMTVDSAIPKPPSSEDWNNGTPTSASEKFMGNKQTKPNFNVETPANSVHTKASEEVRYAYPEDKNASSRRSDWNMEFKDAASAAKAAAESAEMASMAARAAAELASQGNIPLQSSSGQYVLPIYSTKDEQFKSSEGSIHKNNLVEEAKSKDYSRKGPQYTNLNMHSIQSDDVVHSNRKVDSEIHSTTRNLTPKRSPNNDAETDDVVSLGHPRDANRRVDKIPSEIQGKIGKLTPERSLKDDSESEDFLYEDDSKAYNAVPPSFSDTEAMFKNFDYYENQVSDSSNQNYKKSASSHHDASNDKYANWDDHEGASKMENLTEVDFDHYESDTSDHSIFEDNGKDNLFNPTLSRQREEYTDFPFSRNASNNEQHRSGVIFNQSKSGLLSAAETKEQDYAETISDVNSKFDENVAPSYDSGSLKSESDDELDILTNKGVTKTSSFMQRNSNLNKASSLSRSDNRANFTNAREKESILSFPDIDDKGFDEESRRNWSKPGLSVRNKQQTPRAKSPKNLYDSEEEPGEEFTSYSVASDESYTGGTLNIGRLKGGLKNRGYGSPKAESFPVGSSLGPKQGTYETSVLGKISDAAEYGAISEVPTIEKYDKDLNTTYTSFKSSRLSVDRSFNDTEKRKTTQGKSAAVRTSVISQFDDDDDQENSVEESYNHRLWKEKEQSNLRLSSTEVGEKAHKEYSFAARTEYREENSPVKARENQDILRTSDKLKSSRPNKMTLASETQDEFSDQKQNVGSRMQSGYSDSDFRAEEIENVSRRANKEMKISRRTRGAPADTKLDIGSGSAEHSLKSSQTSSISDHSAKVSRNHEHVDSKVIPKSTNSYSYAREPPAEQVDNLSYPGKGTKWSLKTGVRTDSSVISESVKSYANTGEHPAEQVDNLSSPVKGTKWSLKTEDVPPSFPEKDENGNKGSPSSKQTSRENSLKNSSHVHPKLPDYETLAAHFHSLRSNVRPK